jgi:peptidoglycan/xylan/chitin deacetylase (PgdA/CDA1 family)
MSQLDIGRFVKLSISIVYFSCNEVVRRLMKLAGRLPPPRFTILYYHALPLKYREAFSNHMEMMARWARVVPASYRGELSLGKSYVSITFDDAFVSVAENALPELIKHSFHSTIFVPVGSLGRRPGWQMENGAEDSHEIVMTEEQLNKLPDALVTLGAHSITHPHLTQIGRDPAKLEIEGSLSQLRGLTGRDIRLFAFPYGDYDAEVIRICKMAGYDHVYSIEPQAIDASGDKFLRGRTKAEPSDSNLEFFLKLHGAYGWMPFASSLKRKLRSFPSWRTAFQ